MAYRRKFRRRAFRGRRKRYSKYYKVSRGGIRF